jgi:hypothetical protein
LGEAGEAEDEEEAHGAIIAERGGG